MAPTASKRQQIAEYLIDTVFPAIDAGATYNNTVVTVERGIRPISKVADEEFPALFLTKIDEERRNSTNAHFQGNIRAVVVGYVLDANGSPGGAQTALDKLIADVTAAVFQDQLQGGLALSTEVLNVETDDGDMGEKAFFAMLIEFRYSATKAAP